MKYEAATVIDRGKRPLAESIFQQKPCHQDIYKIEIVTKRFGGQVCGLAGAKWDSTQQSLLYKIIILTSQSFRKVLNFKVPEFLDCLYFVVFFSASNFLHLYIFDRDSVATAVLAFTII